MQILISEFKCRLVNHNNNIVLQQLVHSYIHTNICSRTARLLVLSDLAFANRCASSYDHMFCLARLHNMVDRNKNKYHPKGTSKNISYYPLQSHVFLLLNHAFANHCANSCHHTSLH